MKFADIYRKTVEMGMEKDPRKDGDFQRIFEEAKEKIEEDDSLIDEDATWNPYSDSRVHYGDEKEVNHVVVGIDIDTGEVLLADRLKDSGVDGIIGHHPIGRASLGLPGVMNVQTDWMEQFGMAPNIAEGVMKSRISKIGRAVLPSNHQKTIMASELLGLPIMNLHSPADMMAQDFVQRAIDEKEPRKVKDVLDAMKDIPEYQKGREYGLGFNTIVGSKDDRCGKVVVKMAGGTSFGKETYKELSETGVGTVICMHAPEDHIKEAKKHHMKIIVAGHMTSDSIGMNHVCDMIENEGVEVTPISGFLRVKRN